MDTIFAIIKSLRLKHWVKNIFVFPALIFAEKFTDIKSIILAISAFFLFSFAASSVYLINDVMDYDADRAHPIKKNRPIASGRLSRGAAVLLAILFISGTLATSLIVSPYLTLVLLFYFLINFLYSFGFKHIVIIDILMVAAGFVLRAVGGAYAIGVENSVWFLVITFLLTIFLAIMKRRQEFVEISKSGGKTRKVLDNYSIELLDQMSNIVIPAVLVSYIFYTFNTFHTKYFIFTIPLVIYGIFRYLYLVHEKDKGESPTETLLKDWPLLLTVVVWGLISMALIYFYE
ncbi:decaprenyl-phosphate phosphoribosyltransferase [Candidatus Dojkabacteria bacterium]|nr:decaprenyl-phosphate phosphoribosyltransferase [Candidatus Dojkabacteria bacterium]